MTFGSLFAGIGGLDLGLERAGMECKWQVEIDDYARRVLAKHWPNVRRWDDVRTFPPMANADAEWKSQSEGIEHQERRWIGDCCDWIVDLICGGFPCQDISYAGKGAGLAGERSGLWYEFARVIRILRPRFVLVENVSALLTRGLDSVLGTLAADGYDAEWACIPAASVGAPHNRDRTYIVGYRDGISGKGLNGSRQQRKTGFAAGYASPLCHSIIPRLEERSCFGDNARKKLKAAQRANREAGGQWSRDPADEIESGVGRVAHGIPNRMERLRGLGNAVVPQVAEWIGRRILESTGEPT